MIVDFTVENFRSIKNEQLFSLYAEKNPDHHSGNIAQQGAFGILRTSAIYGANASGKSNILKAFQALQIITVESDGWREGDKIPCYDPYLLSSQTENAPTKFSIEFFVNSKRYRYTISYNLYEILEEHLEYYPNDNNRSATLFHRDSPDDWEGVKKGQYLKGGKKKIAFFKNNAYLAKLGNDASSPKVAREIYNFFRGDIDIIIDNSKFGIVDWFENEKLNSAVNIFIKKIDVGIESFRIEQDDRMEKALEKLKNENFDPDLLKKLSKKSIFSHKSEDGSLIDFDSHRESMGTKEIFNALPHLLTVLINGQIVLIDEIERSYHPHIAELIVKLFNDPEVNKRNAQLIFTTHNLSLMSPELMRKDQIYLVEKGLSGSAVSSLDDFDNSNLKDTSPFAKWYDDGRLGAIPNINYMDISSSIMEILENAKA